MSLFSANPGYQQNDQLGQQTCSDKDTNCPAKVKTPGTVVRVQMTSNAK
jgi:hypothetical protein